LPPAEKPRTALKVGDKAPDFALPNGDGKLVMLSEYTARMPVVLVFYRGFW
jgi:peroxiredoxin